MGHQPASDLDAVMAAMDQSPVLLSFCEGDPLVVTAHNARASAIFGPLMGRTPEEAFGATSMEEVGRQMADVVSSGRSISTDGVELDVHDPDGGSHRYRTWPSSRCPAHSVPVAAQAAYRRPETTTVKHATATVRRTGPYGYPAAK